MHSLVRPFLMLLFLVGIQSSEAKPQVAPNTISDVVVATDETTSQSTTYIADESTGTIYYRATTPANAFSPTELKLADFKVFYRGPELSKPSGLAYYNGRLIVSDKSWPAVYEIDTTTRAINLLLKGDPLRDPNRVAVSQSGRLAMANGSGEIVLYDRYSKPTIVKHQFDSPVRLLYAGEELLILEKTGRIQLVQAKSLDSETPVVTALELPARVGIDIPKIIDFAFLNGTYYLVSEKQVVAYIRSKGTVIPLFSKSLDSMSWSGISTDKQSIILKDSRKNSLWQMQRAVPVTASFSKDSTHSLLSLYEYLRIQRTLPLRTFVAPRDYKTFEELLRDQKVIFGRSSSAPNEIVSFVVSLNEGLSDRLMPDGLSVVQNLRKGQTIVLPDLTYSEVVGYETKELAGESVQDYLSRSFTSTNIQSRFTEDFLWSLNELPKAQTLEVQLQKLRGALVATPPRQNLQPGTIIRLGKEQDAILGSVTACGMLFNYGPRSYNLAANIKNSLSGPSAVAQLPRANVVAASTKNLKQFGVDRVEFEMDSPGVLAGDQKSISSAMASLLNAPIVTLIPPADPSATPASSPAPDPKTCLIQRMGGTSYLVVDAVKVKGGRYKIFKDNSVVRLTKNDIQSLGLLGEPDPTGEWSLLLNSPYYVAYRLSPWNDESVLQNATTKLVLSPRRLRPGGTQDIFGLRDGSFLLPYVSQWQVTFLLKESELTNEESEFSKLKASQKFTALRAEETTRLTALVTPNALTIPDGSLTVDAVIKNRVDLKREISFPASTDGIEVNIGIGEALSNVDKNHPDFSDRDCVSAWAREETDPPPSPCVQPTPTVIRRVKAASEFDEQDHGTHVAGLIGGRTNSPVPGLVPSAKLFMVDSTTPETTTRTIRNANSRGVFIYNFSFGLTSDDPELHASIRDEWAKRLFIVAVDNEGSELTLSKNPLIAFMDDAKDNMIGVGSSIGAAGTQYVLGDWQSFRGVEKGSSYGKKYVHLVAPGHSIYSTVSENSYGETTGASQAAPQVSAAAGMLFAADILEPARLKARLIYTSDWYEQFRGKVWGGFLNVNRAVSEPKRNLVITQAAANQTDAIILDDNDPTAKMTIKFNRISKMYEPTTDLTVPDGGINVRFDHILRITELPNKFFRVIYLDDADHLKIVLNATISGKLPCRSLQRWNIPNFATLPATVPCYTNGLDVSQLSDYVGRVPQAVTFGP
jgi:hypothetical protein